MKKIIDLLEEKIREVENDNGEIENLELTEEYIKGYLSGIKHAKTIIKENYEKERLFYDTECCEILNEERVRKLLFEFETQDLLKNYSDYLNGFLELESQFNCIKIEKNDTIEQVLDRLSSCWGIHIIEIKEK